MIESWDVETTTTYTEVGGKRVETPCEPRPVKRRNSHGRFATLRAAQEYCKGRIMYRGRFRTYLEVMECMRESREWSGSVVQPMPNGWRFMHPEGAEMFLRAA